MRKLTEAEQEFILEMSYGPDDDSRWANFDPPFTRKFYDRFVRRGWLEYRNDGREREFRWTEAGRAALTSSPASSDKGRG